MTSNRSPFSMAVDHALRFQRVQWEEDVIVLVFELHPRGPACHSALLLCQELVERRRQAWQSRVDLSRRSDLRP